MLNSHLIGRIGKDAEVRNNNGKSYMSMDVATDFFSKGENKTMWVRVISSDPTIIEKRAQYFKKGSLVTVEGQQLEPSAWLGKEDGKAHAQVVIAASFIDFVRIGKKKDGATPQQQSTATQTQTVTMETAAPTSEAPFPAPTENSEDLPF